MDTFLFVLEIIGTIAFAVSGAMTGLQKNMDIFGVSILGLTTAVGGGVLRDLILGCTPPATFQDPIYAMLSLAVSIILFLQRIRRLLMRNPEQFNRILLLMDSLGLGAFTTVGIQIAYDSIEAPGAFLLIFVGVVTGVGGGVLRDLMASDPSDPRSVRPLPLEPAQGACVTQNSRTYPLSQQSKPIKLWKEVN